MSDDLKYVPVEPHDRATLLYRLASKDPDEVAEALYSATYHDPDWKWVQGWCLTYLKSEHVGVRWAATCLGDLAMFHKRLDLDLVLAALHEAAGDSAIASSVEDSLSYINQFVKVQEQYNDPIQNQIHRNHGSPRPKPRQLRSRRLRELRMHFRPDGWSRRQ